MRMVSLVRRDENGCRINKVSVFLSRTCSSTEVTHFRVQKPYDRLLQNADVRNTSRSDCIEWFNRATQVKLMVK